MIFGFNFPKLIAKSVEPAGHIDNKKIGTRYKRAPDGGLTTQNVSIPIFDRFNFTFTSFGI
jgi:hypothetical protein